MTTRGERRTTADQPVATGRARPPRMLWDISPSVGPASAVFPGDAAYTQRWSSTIGPTCRVNVATLTLSPHTGAHADAPLHYDPEGAAIGSLDLAPFIGPCRVIHAIGRAPLVRWTDIESALAPGVQRVLVRTYTRSPGAWDPAFAVLDPRAVERLADLGVVLVGIDTASIDPADSQDLPSHRVLCRRDLRVIENLVLDDVPAGDYELIALPLKLIAADASPVRAVLRQSG